MAWTVEVTDEFETWWNQLNDEERVSVDGMIRVLETHGTSVGAPYSVGVPRSQYEQLRQLLVPHDDGSICVVYVAEEARTVIALLTGTTETTLGACPPELVLAAEAIYVNYVSRRGGH